MYVQAANIIASVVFCRTESNNSQIFQAVASLKSFMDQIKLLKGERDALEQKFKAGGDTEEISETAILLSSFCRVSISAAFVRVYCLPICID